ncbi:hypothetical protein QAD02_004947 [Eretmocerus hayati]|uniref:Uncharacterized protein n=1 Tax=Eretmocerus hayati TaxID=131215 RepID=A0ACC2NR50_9HYME|nr:hypothetical protein QAD02_004947 [Eretmocerus hayati]
MKFLVPGGVPSNSSIQDGSLPDSVLSNAVGIPSFPNTSTKAINDSVILSALSDLERGYKNYTLDDHVKLRQLQEFHSIFEQHKESLSAQQALRVFHVLLKKFHNIPESITIHTSLVEYILDHVEDLSLEGYISLSYGIQELISCEQREHLQNLIQDTLGQKLSTEFSMIYNEKDTEYLVKAFGFASFLDHSRYHSLIEILMGKLYAIPELMCVNHILSILMSLDRIDTSSFDQQYLYTRILNDLLQQVHLISEDQMMKLIKNIDRLPLKSMSSPQEIRWIIISNCFVLEHSLIEQLVQALIQKVTGDDMTFDLAVTLSVWVTCRVRYRSKELLDYSSTEAFKLQFQEFRPFHVGYIRALIKSLSSAKYKSVAWDDLKDYLTESSAFMNLEYDDLICLTARLMSLDWYPTHFLSKVFDGSFTCSESMRLISYFFCRIYQKIKSDPSYNGPFPTESQILGMTSFSNFNYVQREESLTMFQKYLEEEMHNPDSIRTSVRTQLFHEIANVVGLHVDGTPAPITDATLSTRKVGEPQFLENLRVPDGCHMILILAYSQRSFIRTTNELSAVPEMGVESLQNLYRCPVVVVNKGFWERLPDDEKGSFLMNEIYSKLKLDANGLPTSERRAEGFVSNQPLPVRTPSVKTERSSLRKHDEQRHVESKLVSELKRLHEICKKYPKDSETKIAQLEEYFPRLVHEKHSLSGHETVQLMSILSNYKDIPGCSVVLSSLLDQVIQHMDELSIANCLRLCYAMLNMAPDMEMKKRVMDKIAQNILQDSSANQYDINYLQIALRIAMTFLDQRKYYELIKILHKKILDYPCMIPPDEAISVLHWTKLSNYKPPKWKSVVRRVQNDLAKQAVSLNKNQVIRIIHTLSGMSWIEYLNYQ